MSDLTLDGKVAIVTGAGGGIGRAHALALAEQGARVVVNDLGGNPDGTGSSLSLADTVVKEIIAAGGEAVANYDSVSTPAGGAGIVRTAVDTFGTLDILVNNAGFLRDRSFTKLSVEDFDAILDVHLRGSFFVTQPAFGAMKAKGYGRIIFTASASGLFGTFGQANYAAAKSGVVGLSSVVALEGARYGVTSNVIAPAARTRLTENLIPGDGGDALGPELVAPLVAYLASEQCQLTHEIFSVGGGRFSRAFVGLTPGWFAGRGVIPSVQDIATHLDEIRTTDRFTIPGSSVDESMSLMELLGS